LREADLVAMTVKAVLHHDAAVLKIDLFHVPLEEAHILQQLPHRIDDVG
jgi:hypothetical protein